MGMNIDENTFLEIRYIDPTDENKQAVHAALFELFKRYPTIAINRRTWRNRCTWRDSALPHAMDGNFGLAFHYAHDTGIPDDELLSIALLFSK